MLGRSSKEVKEECVWDEGNSLRCLLTFLCPVIESDGKPQKPCKAGSYIKQSNPSSLGIWVNPSMKITTTKDLVYRYGLCGRKKVGVSSPMNM